MSRKPDATDFQNKPSGVSTNSSTINKLSRLQNVLYQPRQICKQKFIWGFFERLMAAKQTNNCSLFANNFRHLDNYLLLDYFRHVLRDFINCLCKRQFFTIQNSQHHSYLSEAYACQQASKAVHAYSRD